MSDQIPKDEINIIELIAVIIRYRRLIVGTVIASIFLSLLAVLILPNLHKNEPKEKQLFSNEANIRVLLTPDVMAFVESDVLFNYVKETITDPEIFLDALKLVETDSFAGIDLTISDENALLNSLRVLLDENAGIFAVIQNINGFNLKLKTDDFLDIYSFYESLIDLTNKHLYNLLRSYADGQIWEYKNVLLKEYPFAAVDEKQQHIYNKYSSASRFYAQYYPALMTIQNPYSKQLPPINDNDSGRKQILDQTIIFSVSAIFLSIFVSFLLNLISKVRNNSQSMEILRKAVRRERS